MASMSRTRPSLLSCTLGAKPPSSPTLQASCPYFALMIPFSTWYTAKYGSNKRDLTYRNAHSHAHLSSTRTHVDPAAGEKKGAAFSRIHGWVYSLPSLPMRTPSANEGAPTGRIMNSCMAKLLPAWLPPLITLKAGTGMTSSFVPDISWMCLYKGAPLAPAPALHTLRDTPRMALAPSFDLFGVPSNSSMMASTSAWFLVAGQNHRRKMSTSYMQRSQPSSRNENDPAEKEPEQRKQERARSWSCKRVPEKMNLEQNCCERRKQERINHGDEALRGGFGRRSEAMNEERSTHLTSTPTSFGAKSSLTFLTAWSTPFPP